jgi:hypothetical protein
MMDEKRERFRQMASMTDDKLIALKIDPLAGFLGRTRGGNVSAYPAMASQGFLAGVFPELVTLRRHLVFAG